MKTGRASVTMADSVQPAFGVPWVDLEAERARLEAMGEEELQAFWVRWNELERLREADPTQYGWKLPSWDEVLSLWKEYQIHVILGGNKSSKSSFMGRAVVELAEKIPECEIRCYHVDEKHSKEDQQTFVWDALPLRYKAMQTQRGRNFSVQYTQSNGFVGDKVIFPPHPGYKRGSTIYFGNYNQYKQNAQVTEGWKVHLVWCDEAVPPEMFATLLMRLTDFRGRIVLTFTTIKGWTTLVSRILGKVRVLKKRYAPLARQNVPVLEESLSQPGAIIHSWWTEDNPFIPQDAKGWRALLVGRPMSEILARAYGRPQKSATTVFPKFSEAINVVRHEDLPWLREGGQKENYALTRYQGVDGAGARNWFMVWVAIDAAGTWWVYREWPDVESVGEWAVPGTQPGGSRGLAQQSFGDGTQAYVDRIKKLEKGDPETFERYIDPRFAATEKQLKGGVITPQQELADLGMHFIASPGVHEDAGLQEINTLLEYNEDLPMSATNSPKLYISDRCQNTIFAFAEYTGTQGKDEATKDPIDIFRYLATAKIQYMDLTQRPKRRAAGY